MVMDTAVKDDAEIVILIKNVWNVVIFILWNNEVNKTNNKIVLYH